MNILSQLVYKRGFAKVNGQRVPIASNTIVEQKLSKQNIICVEDLIHEIFSVGEKFKVSLIVNSPITFCC